MSALVDFLLARVAEDEAVAIASRDYFDALDWGIQSEWNPAWRMDGPVDGPSGHGALIVDPARVLAECEAKRRIVERYEFERNRRDAYRSPRSREIEDEQATQDRRTQEARSAVAEDVVRLLALPYADHPDYDQAWRPE